MTTLTVGFNRTTFTATVVPEGDAIPEGSTDIGSFDHPDAVYPDSYVIYHGVRDLLYKVSAADPSQSAMFPDNITDMAKVVINVIGWPPVALTSISLGEDFSMEEGATYPLEAVYTPENATLDGLVFTFASSDTDVATVGEDGTVTALAEGVTTVTITLTGNEAITDSVEITVTTPA